MERYAQAAQRLVEPQVGAHDQLAQAYASHSQRVSSTEIFLPWHRVFLRTYEISLQNMDPNVILPYWDWSLDVGNGTHSEISRSFVLSSEAFGGGGQPPDGCVVDGFFANLPLKYPSLHCLTRTIDQGHGVALTREKVQDAVANASGINDLTRRLEEMGEAMRLTIGGEYGDMRFDYAPNDPLFYPVFANLDRIWWRWQRVHPAQADTLSRPDDVMQPWGITVKSVLDTRSERLCYVYAANREDDVV